MSHHLIMAGQCSQQKWVREETVKIGVERTLQDCGNLYGRTGFIGAFKGEFDGKGFCP